MYFCTSVRSFSGWWISCEPKGAKKMMFAEHYTVCLMTQPTSSAEAQSEVGEAPAVLSALCLACNRGQCHQTVTASALTVCPTNGITTLLQWGKMHRENSSSTLFAVIKKMDAMKNTLNVIRFYCMPLLHMCNSGWTNSKKLSQWAKVELLEIQIFNRTPKTWESRWWTSKNALTDALDSNVPLESKAKYFS